jgi:hypothetical protein
MNQTVPRKHLTSKAREEAAALDTLVRASIAAREKDGDGKGGGPQNSTSEVLL